MSALRSNEHRGVLAPRRDRTVPTLDSHVPISPHQDHDNYDHAIFIVLPRTRYSLDACPALEEQPTRAERSRFTAVRLS